MLREVKDTVDSLDGTEELLDNTPPRNVTVAVYVNNQCAARNQSVSAWSISKSHVHHECGCAGSCQRQRLSV